MARVLLVEDDRWMGECYALWLTQAGHNVTRAASAQKAMDVLDDGQWFDLILLDMLLPQANGVQLLHQLQTYPDIAGMPIVICSATSLPPALAVADYGVRAVLDKTDLTPERLRKAVGRYAAA